MSTDKSLREQIKEFIDNTPPDTVKAIWDKICNEYPDALNHPTADEFLKQAKELPYSTELVNTVLAKIIDEGIQIHVTKSEAVEFLTWCNTPVGRSNGELAYILRVQALYPEYDTYYIKNEYGRPIQGEYVFLTAEQVYDYWLQHKDDGKE
jgi:hypothetical protein